MSAALKKHISKDRIRSLRVAIYSFTSCNTFLLAASFAFSSTSFNSTADLVYLIPQICIFVCTIVYCFFIAKYNNPGWQLIFAMLLAATYLYFAVSVYLKLAAGASNVLFLFWIVESVNVLIAALVLTEASFTWLIRKDDPALSGDDEQQQRQPTSGQGGTDPTVPQAVHLYQPRLSLPLSPRGSNVAGSIHSARRHSAQASSTDGVVIQEGDEDDLWLENDLELEELPKYQRRRPVQSATIIDLSNLASVDSTVLNTVIRDSDTRLSFHSQASLDAVHDIVINDPLEDDTTAPEYSPPLLPSLAPGPIPEVVINFATEEGDQVSRDATESTALEATSTSSSTTTTATPTTATTIPPPQTTAQSSIAPEPPVYAP